MAYRDKQWAIKIYHTLAKPLIYQELWTDAKFVLLENNPAYNVLDISGLDVIINLADNIDFMAQRFRTVESSLEKGYDDFTLRNIRPSTGYKAEGHKLLQAYRNGNNIAKYYAYGHVNAKETGFEKFRILYLRRFLEKWDNGELPEPDIVPNRDGSSDFIAWKFKDLPKKCIFCELKNPTKLKQTKLGGSQ